MNVKRIVQARQRIYLSLSGLPARYGGPHSSQERGREFLFRRLETLRDLAGEFWLNVELPIAFDGWGRMEVDLLCQESRLAIELDGVQHFADLDAYRRGRRKHALLQENRYFVLRFLTEDAGVRLEEVLDTIRAAPNTSAQPAGVDPLY
jgi:hypothetical protein